MDYTVHGILQARILEWVAFPFSRGFFQPGVETRSPTLQADSLPAELSQCIKKQRHSFADKSPSSQSYGFSSSHVQMWELGHRAEWAAKKKTLESPFDNKEIKLVNLKENQAWVTYWKDRWSWNSNILVTWCKQLSHCKRPWCWKKLTAVEEGIRGWGGWVASLM